MTSRLMPLFVAALALGCAGCATPPTDPDARAEFDKANDPIEPTNRAIFDANHYADRHVMKPVAQAYEDWVPGGVRNGVHNVLVNLKEPVVLMNDLLQANTGAAWTTARRFAVNSTAGGLGIFDVAGDWDLPHHEADFGQTFGVWGIGEGPFLELPLLGPTNTRDAVGTAVGFVANPFSYIGGSAMTYVEYARGGFGVVDERGRNIAALDDLEQNSVDFYAELRSISRQRREALVEQGKSPGSPKPHIDVTFPGATEEAVP